MVLFSLYVVLFSTSHHSWHSLKSCNAGIRSMRESCKEWILQPISRSSHHDQVSVLIDVLHRWSTPIRYQRSFPSNNTRKSWRRQSVIYDQHILRLESAKWRSFRLQSNPVSKHAWGWMDSNACVAYFSWECKLVEWSTVHEKIAAGCWWADQESLMMNS